jgi:hypothetical protein
MVHAPKKQKIVSLELVIATLLPTNSRGVISNELWVM